MKRITKKQLAARLDDKDFHEPIRDTLIQAARESNLVVIYSDHLDFIRFDGAVSDYVYADDAPFRLARHGLVRDGEDAAGPVVEIHPYRFGRRDDEVMAPALYARLGKPVWDFDCGAVVGRCAPFSIRERQDFGEGVDCFCRGVVVDLDELFPVERNS